MAESSLSRFSQLPTELVLQIFRHLETPEDSPAVGPYKYLTEEEREKSLDEYRKARGRWSLANTCTRFYRCAWNADSYALRPDQLINSVERATLSESGQPFPRTVLNLVDPLHLNLVARGDRDAGNPDYRLCDQSTLPNAGDEAVNDYIRSLDRVTERLEKGSMFSNIEKVIIKSSPRITDPKTHSFAWYNHPLGEMHLPPFYPDFGRSQRALVAALCRKSKHMVDLVFYGTNTYLIYDQEETYPRNANIGSFTLVLLSDMNGAAKACGYLLHDVPNIMQIHDPTLPSLIESWVEAAPDIGYFLGKKGTLDLTSLVGVFLKEKYSDAQKADAATVPENGTDSYRAWRAEEVRQLKGRFSEDTEPGFVDKLILSHDSDVTEITERRETL